MNRKRILLVSLSAFVILAVVLGAAAFILPSRSSAQVDEALSNPPAAVSEEQAASEYEAKYETYFTEKDSLSGSEGYAGDGYGCNHDSQSFDWSAED